MLFKNTIYLNHSLTSHIMPTKWRSHRGHRFCDVTPPYVCTSFVVVWWHLCLHYAARSIAVVLFASHRVPIVLLYIHVLSLWRIFNKRFDAKVFFGYQRLALAGCVQIPPSQFPGDIQDTFLNSRRFLQAIQYRNEVKLVMSEDLLFLSFSWHLLGSDHSDPVYPRTSRDYKTCIKMQ